MLQLLMIPSGNNAARLLARWDAGSEDEFVEKMNDAAKDLGMTELHVHGPERPGGDHRVHRRATS